MTENDLGDVGDDLAELQAMTAVVKALSPLDDDERGRIIRWAAEKYVVSLPRAPMSTTGSTAVAEDSQIAADAAAAQDEIAEDEPEFAEFGELFSAADPRSNDEKVLVAAYWRQIHVGEDKWQSSELQKDLRNLGHAIPNITDALTSNMRKRPQRVIQLQKSGSSRQARKTYKMTREGLMHVKAMLGTDD